MSDLRITGLRLLLASVAYFAVGRLGLEFGSVSSIATLIWAPSGLGLALLMRWGPRMLIAIFAGLVAIGVSIGVPLGFSIAAILAGCVEPLVGVAILRATGFDRFRHAGDVVRLIGAAMGAAAVAAAIGASGLALTYDTNWSVAARSWWLGNFTGILVVAPLVLTFSKRAVRKALESSGRRLEAGAILIAFAGVSLVVFAPIGTDRIYFLPPLLILPVVGWAAYRFGVMGFAVTNLLLAATAMTATLLETGPFMVALDMSPLALATIFIITAAIAGLQLAVVADAQRAAEVALKENLTWLDLTQATAGVATWSWDAETNRVRVSDSALRLMGIPEVATTSSGEEFFSAVHPDDQEAVARAVIRTHRSGEPAALDFRIVDKSAGVRWYALRAERTPLDSSSPERGTRTVGAYLDITDNRRLQEAVRRNERLASLGTFAAGLAHEINNPIGGILLAAHAARSLAAGAGVSTEPLDDIIQDAQRTGRIVKSILQFSKTDQAGRAPHDLNACVRQAVRLTGAAIEDRGVTIDLSLSDQPVISTCSATEIEQVVVNLIQNALAACSAGGRIRLESLQDGATARICIVDDGVGMPESVRLRAFDPFYTTRTLEGGSGLGLSICHGIIESHGGQISISSQQGLGTTVEFSLPMNGSAPRE